MSRRPIHLALLFILLLTYWTISLRNLAVAPPVYEDEPWQASTGWKIARDGVFGTDLFAGYYGMERRYYGYMPLHPFLLAAIFRFAGVGLFQARFEPVALGLLTLALTAGLARRLFKDHRVAVLAVLFLVAVRTTGLTPSQVSGILFLDMARIARYDMLVPVWGLASLHVYLMARARGRARWHVLAGLLVGLAGLSHLYGVFYLLVLLVLGAWDGPRRAWVIGCVLFGFVLPWLPYAAYVLSDIPNWRGQTRGYGDRFDLLNAQWYLENLLREPQRYGPGLGPAAPGWLLRAGFWSACVALPSSLVALFRRGWQQHDRAARVLVLPAVLLPILFALFIRLKLSNYLVAIMPFFSMAAAWGGVALWDRAGRMLRPLRLRLALVIALVAVVGEGVSRIAALESAAAATTPYADFIGRVRQAISPTGTGARVLGLHNYWFGLENYDYRSFAVPILWADAVSEPRPVPLDEGLDRIAPDVVLIDSRLQAYFDENTRRGGDSADRFKRWLDRRGAERIGRIDDPTYGSMEIYGVAQPDVRMANRLAR